VLFTGSGGCGKTTGLLMSALADVDRPGYRALLVQRTLAGPVTLAEQARAWLEGTDAAWDSNARVWRFPSGATLDFGHERFLYTAGEYHFVGCDDLTLFADHEYRRLFQVWRRRQGSRTPMRARVATSPGGPGHDWVRERFSIDSPADALPLALAVDDGGGLADVPAAGEDGAATAPTCSMCGSAGRCRGRLATPDGGWVCLAAVADGVRRVSGRHPRPAAEP